MFGFSRNNYLPIAKGESKSSPFPLFTTGQLNHSIYQSGIDLAFTINLPVATFVVQSHHMFPEIKTGRFLLRKIIPSDHFKIFEGLSHPDITKYYGVAYTTLESTKAQMDFYDDLLASDTGIWWAICNKNNRGDLIGTCGLNDWNKQHNHIEIGYWLLPGYHGRGVMSECIPFITRYAFDQLKVHRIVAVVEEGNGSSTKLLLRLGFIYEGRRTECEIKNGRYISLQYFALVNNLPRPGFLPGNGCLLRI